MSVVIVKSLQKQCHVIKRWNMYLTYQHQQLSPKPTLEWRCVVLAVGVVTSPEKGSSKAFALVALRRLEDENIAEWSAPTWMSGNRLLPRTNLFTTGATSKVNRPKIFDTDTRVDAFLNRGPWDDQFLQFREVHWITRLAVQSTATAERPAVSPTNKKGANGKAALPYSESSDKGLKDPKKQKVGVPDTGHMVVVSGTGLELPLSPSKLQPWQQNQSIPMMAQQMLAAQQMQQQMFSAQHAQWMQFSPLQQQIQPGQQQQQMQPGQQQQQVASIRQGHDEDTREELKFAREAQIVANERAHQALLLAMNQRSSSSVDFATTAPAAKPLLQESKDLSPAVPKPLTPTEEVISAWLKLNGIAHTGDVVSKLVELGVEEGEDVLILAHEKWKECGFRDVPLVKLQRLKEKL
jgi:hypothetical protein